MRCDRPMSVCVLFWRVLATYLVPIDSDSRGVRRGYREQVVGGLSHLYARSLSWLESRVL